MTATTLSIVWVLVSLDCALIGYRVSMGRSALLDKRRYHRRHSVRAALFGQPALVAVTLGASLLVARGSEDLAPSFDAAARRLLVVAVPYAACILATTALCLVPSVTVRTAATVVIFGPFSLLRPVVVIAAVAHAVVPDPRWPLVAVGLAVAVPGVLVEPCADHQVRRRLLRSLTMSVPDVDRSTTEVAHDRPRTEGDARCVVGTEPSGAILQPA